MVDAKLLSDLNYASSLEWIEANGLGGYASGTVSGAHTRRYHGLLVAALSPPVDRTVLLSKLEETIVRVEAKGDAEKSLRFELATNQYPGVVHPEGYRYLKTFRKDLFPVFHYEVGGVVLKKTIAAIHGENTTLILYEVVEAPASFTLELLPLYSARDFHTLSRANDSIGIQYLFGDGVFRTMNYEGGTEFFIGIPRAEFREARGWYYNFEYAVEKYRGLDFQEDLYSHGVFCLKLKKGSKVGIIVSTDNPEGRDPFKLFTAEKKRREKLLKAHGQNEKTRSLLLAADQFIVKRGERSTIIAGYHWFADWGRDTMISLPGLCLATGRHEDAKQIIRQFSECVSEGMLPNRFADHGGKVEYNTMDATLWFFHAIHQYYQHTMDIDFVTTLLPLLKEIIRWHYKGTRYHIKVDPIDELLQGGEEGVQLTWMDARVFDWVVTPRMGKPVEINALWHNALRVMELLTRLTGEMTEADDYAAKAGRVASSFNKKFWNEKDECLYDFIHDEIGNDDMRPNQIFALSLPFPLLPKAREKKVLDIVTAKLLTPRGLRTLSPSHPDYKSFYGGDVWQRDGGYHQGTVWSFLLGPYVDSLFRVKGEKARTEAFQVVNTFLDHLDEAGVGNISEIFDANPPHTPRGCIAQAWGVGEILRIVQRYGLLPQAE